MGTYIYDQKRREAKREKALISAVAKKIQGDDISRHYAKMYYPEPKHPFVEDTAKSVIKIVRDENE
jgi:hypothetical protein